MGDVTALPPVAPEINHDLVDHIEDMLARVKTGEIKSMAFLAEWENGVMSDSFSLWSGTNVNTLVGALYLLMTRIATVRLGGGGEEYIPEDDA